MLSFGLLQTPHPPKPEPEPEPGAGLSNTPQPLAQLDLGDLVLGVEYLHRWAIEASSPEGAAQVTWRQRTPVVITHGLSHLLGHAHEDDEEHDAMLSCERQILSAGLRAAARAACSVCEEGCAEVAVDRGWCCARCTKALRS